MSVPRSVSRYVLGVTGLDNAAPKLPLMQQGQHRAFGFTDPVLYRLSGTPAFHDVLPMTSRTPGCYRGDVCNIDFLCSHPLLQTFDDQNPSMLGYTGQVTRKGYDNMTGIGTPRGQRFITALRKLEG